MSKQMENLILSSHERINNINSLQNTANTMSENNYDSQHDASSGEENDQGSLTLNSNFSTRSSRLFSKENNDKSCKDDKSYKDSKNSLNDINYTQNQESIKHFSSSVELRKHSSDQKKDPKGRHRKKKSWYSNILYPTYKSRSESFKKIFKDVPDEERLVVDYSCALQREILVHGRLYVTQNYLCFYANIFMWETLATIRWKDVTSITKEKTALVIPNAIAIHTANEKFFFASFGSRDKAFMMLFKVWQNALMGKQMNETEIWQLVHDSYGKELGLASDDEDYAASLSAVSKGEKSPKKNLSLESVSDDMNKFGNLTTLNGQGQSVLLESSLTHSATGVTSERLSDLTDSTESDKEKEIPVSASICTSPHNGRQMIKAQFPINVDQLFTLLFTSSKFFLDFHTSRKTTDLIQSAWTEDPVTGRKIRKVSLTVSLNKSVGPKTSQVTETQHMLSCTTPGQIYSITVETTNAGIPYADSFSVFSHYCLARVSKNESSLTVYTEIKYKKNIWGLVKTFIDKNCWAGLQEFFNSLVKAITIECEQKGEFIRGQQRKSTITSGATITTHSPDHTAFNHQTPVSKMSFNPKNLVPDLHKEDNYILSWVILIAVICLIFINCLLYFKLSSLEEANTYAKMDLHVLKNTPKTEEDWITLLQQQESLHTVEVKKWQRILHTAIQLLKQTEESLTQLQLSVHPTATEKIFSVLKPSLNIVQNDRQRGSEL